MFQKFLAELIGSYILVFVSLILPAIFNDHSYKAAYYLLVAFSIGFSFVFLQYTLGYFSGGHFNPIITLAFLIHHRLNFATFLSYFTAQLLGAFLGAVSIYVVVVNSLVFRESNYLNANGYGIHAPNGHSLTAVFILEAITASIFCFTFFIASKKSSDSLLMGLAVGLCYAVMHLIALPISNAGLNPAKSIVAALFSPSWAMQQLWLFILVPFIGSAIGSTVANFFD